MQQLYVTDPHAVDAAIAPKLRELEGAVKDHKSI